MKKLFGYGLLAVVLIIGSIFWYVRHQLQDDSVPLIREFKGESAMFFFPHPDDEVTSAGTLKILHDQGVTTTLITLTKGEAGSTNGMVHERDPEAGKAALGKIREQEVLAVGKLLGVDHQEVLGFPDNDLKAISPNTLKKVIREEIARYKPTILFCHDDKVGLYGHLDHSLTAKYVKEVFLEDRGHPDFSANQLYMVTLPAPMIRVALKISRSFQSSYPKDPTQGLPMPTVAIRITAVGGFKRDAMLLHQSQRPTFNDMQPYFDKFPSAIYYRIFDKEYFAEVR